MATSVPALAGPTPSPTWFARTPELPKSPRRKSSPKTQKALACLIALVLFGLSTKPTTQQQLYPARGGPEPTKAPSSLPFAKEALPIPIEPAPQEEGSHYSFIQASPLSSSSAYFAEDHILYVFSTPAQGEANPQASPDKKEDPPTNKLSSLSYKTLKLNFKGQNPKPRIHAEGELPSKTNYFTGSDPASWRTEVPNYSVLRYQEIYPGTDALFYTKAGKLSFDLVLEPGADPGRIRLFFETEGLGGAELDEAGNLVLGTEKGDIHLEAPHAYYKDTEEPIASYFYLEGPRGEVGIHLDPYDQAREVVIDPALSYSSYLGGSDLDEAKAIAIDSSGAAYVAGRTLSTNFPTQGPFQGTYGGGFQDAFVAKVSPSGATLSYSSYLGGDSDDVGQAIAVDSSGAAYITGWTISTNFPTAGTPFQGSRNGIQGDAFVTKVSPSGSTLSYSTYLGGTGGDTGRGIAVDSSGAAYLTGDTLSGDFPIAGLPFQSSKSGQNDVFVTKMNPSGSSLSYSSFLGGSSADIGQAIAVDSSGAAYLTGYTYSTDFPTQGPFQGAHGSPGETDAFVAKISPTGSTLSYSSYLGGNGDDQTYGISVDSSGAAYVAGGTQSSNFPIAGSPFQPGYNGNDAFVTKVAPSGNALAYSSYLGGLGSDSAFAIAVDSSGAAYVTGSTNSADFPLAGVALQGYAGGQDAFVTKVAPSGSTLSYSSFLGGSSGEWGYGIAVDSSGFAYVAGQTNSTNFPTKGAFQGSFGGTYDAFVAKVLPDTTIQGTVTNGAWGRVSVYRASDGVQVGTTIAGPSGGWSLLVPFSDCASGEGYKILAQPNDSAFSPEWYNDGYNFTEASCVSAPAGGPIDWALPAASSITGSVHQDPTHSPIPGAVVYAYTASSGTLAGWTRADSSGNFSLSLSGTGPYKLLATATGYANTWCCPSQANFSSASSISSPSSEQMIMMPSSSSISGTTRDQETSSPIDEVRVYAYDASTGAFVGYGVSGRSGTPGTYSIPLPAGSYKLYAKAPTASDEDTWYPTPSASGFGDAASVSAPSSGIDFGLQDAALIEGQALCSGVGVQGAYVSAYDSSGTRYPYNVVSQPGGSYSIKTRASSTYKIRFMAQSSCPGNKTVWYQDATGFGGASTVSPPASGIDQDLNPA